jgi:signal transduction histidine kinase
LRGPLRGIDGFSKTLIEEYSHALDETARDYLARVRNAAQRLGRLIDDLLMLVSVGRTELGVTEEVDLSEMAGSIVEHLQSGDSARDVEFIAEPGIRVRCDPRLIRTALQHLLDNAWKFTANRRTALIEFGRTESGGETAFYVRDNGDGFDMAHAGNLFSAFQRAHPSEEFGGNGVGLATVERIVRKHGGRVWAEAEPGVGVTVFFTLHPGIEQ